MDTIASAFPNNKFAIVDDDVTFMKHKPKNVEGLLFSEQQAGYLVGYAAGMWAKSHGGKAVGSVGGLKIPPVDRYIAGFQYGAKKADPGIKTLNGYSNDFVKQAKCKETALNQIAQGSVVEFQVAGQCGLGVLDASHEKGIFGIGVDADQGYLGSWVMTSALKRVDVSVYNAIQAANHGTLEGGTQQAVQRLDRRRRVRQVELEGPRVDQERGGRAVQAAEGRQDQGHPDHRQVDASELELVRRGGPNGPPLASSRVRRDAAGSNALGARARLRARCERVRRRKHDARRRPPGRRPRRRAGFASASSGR